MSFYRTLKERGFNMKKNIAMLLLLVLTVTAGCRANKDIVRATGTIEVREVDIGSRIGSRVTTLLADEGASVKKGDVLAELDSGIVKAQKDIAEALYDQAKDNYDKAKNLYESGAVPQQQFDQANTNLINAQSNRKQAGIMLNEAKIIAPWDGVILEKNIEVGEIVSPNAPMFVLGDLTTAKVSIYVPLPQLGLIKLNQPAKVMVDSFKKWFDGRVTFISGKAEFTPKNIQTKDERVKEVFEIEVTVPNPDYELKPGMPADVEVLTAVR